MDAATPPGVDGALTPPLEVELQHVDGAAVLVVVGEVDAFTAPQLRRSLDEALTTAVSRVFVDASGICFFGAAGAGELLGAAAALGDGGEVVVVDPSPSVRLVLTHLDGARRLRWRTSAFAPR